MEQIFYIQIGGVIWKLSLDGKIQPLGPNELVPEQAEIIALESMQDIDATITAIAENEGNSTQLIASPVSSTNTNITSGLQGASEGSVLVNIFGAISRLGRETLAKAGFQTQGAPEVPEPQQAPEQGIVGLLDPDATISININDDENLADSYVNRFENPSVDFFGDTLNIDDGWTVELTLVDSLGQVFQSLSTISINSWQLDNQDLKPLAEGPFTAIATVRDNFGNSVSDAVNSVKDTLAEGISIEADTGTDTVVDLFEAESAELSGQFSNVQAGALVNVCVSDSQEQAINFTVVIDATGRWSSEQDLRALSEGRLTLFASTTDLAGNPAIIESQIELVLSPNITLENPDRDGAYDDDTYNQFEAPRQDYFGTVFNVEDGQTVSLTLTDMAGSNLQASALVIDGRWSVISLDTSTLADGQLKVMAEVSNLDGAETVATLSRAIDQTAQLSAEYIDPNVDGVINALEALSLAIRGAVIDIEAGQPAAVVITDGAGRQFNTVGQVQNSGLWLATGVDLSKAIGPNLTLTVSALDIAGNPAQATTMIAYDPLAIIADQAVDNLDGDGDQLFNAAEISAGITLSGLTDNIEAGQSLTIMISDGVNSPVTETISVQGATGLLFDASAGTWKTLDNVLNISTLNDGDLTVTVTGQDVAGNLATGTDVVHKDTQAAITVEFRGDNPDDDRFSGTEISAVVIGGSVTDVETGREVTVVLSGLSIAGVSQPDITFTTLVQSDSTFSSLNNGPDQTYDLSGFDDGTVSVQASVTDTAGNPASNSNTAVKDTELNLDIDTGINGLSISKIKTSIGTIFRGTTDAEEGQFVTLEFDDGDTQFTVQALVNEPGKWTTGAYDSVGVWQASPIIVSGLNNQNIWSLTTQVEDLAGNTAVDDTPTLIQPLPILLSEGQLIIGTGTDVKITSLRIDIGGDASINDQPFTFSDAARQQDLSVIRSSGSDTSVSVTADGKSLRVIRDSDSAIVLEARINESAAAVTLTLLQSVEQSGDDRVLLTGILLQAAQNDIPADSQADVVESKLSIVIRDNISNFLVDDSYQVIEAVTATGNLYDNDNQGEAPLTLVSITYQGTDYPIDPISPNIITTSEGTLLVNAEGEWGFTPNRNQDNSSANPTLTFSYSVSDADGDIDTADVIIEVLDGAEGIIQPISATDTEVDYANLGDPTSNSTFNVIVVAGSDNLVPASLALTSFTETQLNALNPPLKSNGEVLEFSLSPDGRTLTATTTPSNTPVFILTVSASQASNGQDLAGTVEIKWLAPLDHDNAAGDALNIELFFTAADTDGTPVAPVEGLFTLVDGALPNVATVINASIAENGLSVGPVVATGQASVNLGSDALDSLTFGSPATQPVATSQGQALIYQLATPTTLVASVGGPNYPTDTLDLIEVFRVTLDPLSSTTSDSSVNYEVTLSRAVDQPNTPGLSDGLLSLPLTVELQDFDGDSALGQLLVVIADSDPALVPDITLNVSETPVKTGSELNDTDASTMLVTAGLDRIDTLNFGVSTGDPVMDTQATPNALSSGGQALTWRDAGGGVLQARIPDGTVIFIITAPDTISLDPSTDTALGFSVEMFGSIDHLSAVTDTASLSVPVLFIDSDGTVSQAQIVVNIDDGLDPSIASPDNLLVSEADITTGAALASEVIFGVSGSDAIGAINVTLINTVFTSDGRTITLVNTSPITWEGQASTGTGSTEVIFTLAITPNGNTDFELKAAIRHVSPPNNTASDENNATIEFTVEGVDVDGDSTGIQNLVVNVTDGIPISPIYDPSVVPELTEGEVANGNLFTDANVLTQGSFGPDGGDIFNIVYKGQNYRFVADPSDSGATVGDPVNIDLIEAGSKYGTLTIQSNGDYVVAADNVFNLLGGDFPDQISYDFWDNDGDASTGNVYKFKVVDGQGAIFLSPNELDEDNPSAMPFELKGNPGDIDDGENITQFKIEKAALNGGIFKLDGVELTGDATHYIIINLVDTMSGVQGEKQPDGTLVFYPEADSSNQTQSVIVNVEMTVDKLVGSNDVVTDSFAISVVSVADTPEWSTGTYNFTLDEDSGRTQLSADPAQLQDTDSSETLSYEVVSLDTGIQLFVGSRELLVDSTLTAAEFAQLSVEPAEDISGVFNFTLNAIATEAENADQAFSGQVFEVDVKGVADVPTLTVRNLRGIEDVDVPIVDAFEGSLTDDDNSESLWFKVFLPSGWSIVNAPSLVPDPLDGSIFVSFTDIQAGAALRPKEDLSQETEVPTIRVRAVAVEDLTGPLIPSTIDTLSDEKSFTVKLTGVADEPLLTPGPNGFWSYDDTTATLTATTTFNEDEQVALDFGVSTEDDDGSEIISLHLSGLPAGAALFNGSGQEVFLSVFDASDVNDPVYTVTQTQLADLFFEPPRDFSGAVSLNLEQINTEPDGDSNAFDVTINFVVAPVVDTEDNQQFGPDIEQDRDNENGLEDIAKPVVIDIELDDIDGSERVTDLVFDPIVEGILTYNGIALTGLSMADLAATEGVSLTDILTNGNLKFQAPEDRHGDFNLDFTYEITDTNGGASADTVTSLTGRLLMDVRAQVDRSLENTVDSADTRLKNIGSGVLVSTDGSPIDVSGQLVFVEEDLDGSEVIDYVMIKMPSNSGWFIDQPIGQAPPFYGAIHDGFGNWLLRPPASTSATVQEQLVEILDSVSISSRNSTAGPVTIVVEVRVKDGIDDAHLDDAEILFGNFQVQFDVGSGTTMAFDPDNIVGSIVDGIEGMGIRGTATMAEHIIDGLPGNGVAGDSDELSAQDHISFRVDAADLPYGARLSGTDVRALFATDGSTLISYVFGEAALQDITMVGLNEDFSGRFDIPFNVIATDPSGDVKLEVQTFTFNIEPLVDQLDLLNAEGEPFEVLFTGVEDTFINLRYDYQSLLGDKDIDSLQGTEQITSLTFSNLQGGSFFDPLSLLSYDSVADSYTLSNPTDLRLDAVFFKPPENYSGQRVVEDGVVIEPGLGIDVSFEITDTTTGNTVVSNTDTATRSTTLYFNVDPVVDIATLCDIDTVTGHEDSKIDIVGLCAELIDDDGSESISLQITGVPEGAVIFAGGAQLPNNGLDGGSVSGGDLDGRPTYSWSVTQAQLANIQIRPPQDFSGDIVLTLEAITNEKGTGQFASTREEFTVGVMPVADGVQLTLAQLAAQGDEGESVEISVGALVLETVNPNETIELSVTAMASSDASALIDLSRILVGADSARFTDNGDGSFTAILLTTAASLDLFTLRPGDVAWGNLALQVDVRSVDNNTVLGVLQTDTSAAESFIVQVDIAPDPDPALLTRQFDGIVASNGLDLDMGLTVTQVNPAPGETTVLEILSLPSEFSFNQGGRQGGTWVIDLSNPIDLANLADLQLLTDTGIATNDPSGEFALQLRTVTTLDGETAQSTNQTLLINIRDSEDAQDPTVTDDQTLVGSSGNDYYKGAAGADEFVWSNQDQGTVLSVAKDQVADFNSSAGSYNSAEGDSLDLSGLFADMSVTNGVSADQVINVDDASGDTVFSIKVDGALLHNLEIRLTDVAKTDLMASYDDSGTSEADFLQHLIDNALLQIT